MVNETAMGPGAEFDAIRLLIERWGPRARGVGDDAAVLEIPRGDLLVASVDACVEFRHFERAWVSPADIGWRAVMAALSDLAAMAATPRALLLSLVVPANWRAHLGELADGIGEAADAADVSIAGGNLTAGDVLELHTTVLGAARTPLHRHGLRPGDALWVTGALGGPGAAIAAWRSGGEPRPVDRERFARPRARLREALWLARHGATAAVDVSDGLGQELGHLAAANRLRLTVDLETIPCVAGAAPERALASGEEYEIIVGAPATLDAAAFERDTGTRLTRIGTVERAAGPEVLVMHRGARVANAPGHDHFSG